MTETQNGNVIPARVYLQPIAPPVTLGLWGFFASTMVLSTWMLHWWGTAASRITSSRSTSRSVAWLSS